MNIKPTEQQVRKWAEGAGKYADMKRKTWEAWDLLRDQKLAELAAKWGAEQAQQPNATPRKSMAYTPRQEQIIMVCDILHRISESYDHWKGWSGIKSNCEQAINLLRYDSTQAQQPTIEEPELPEAVADVQLMTTGGNAGVSTVIRELDNPMAERLYPGDKLYTAAQMQAYADAKVRAAMAAQQGEKQ